MQHPLIYLTGAPASGKSTAVRDLQALVPALERWDYGAELRAIVSRDLKREVGYDELRADSGRLTHPEHIAALDERLIAWSVEARRDHPAIIDSHAVTRETYGFRALPFSTAQWMRLDASHIFALYASPATIRSRMEADPAGRLAVDDFHAGFHAALQGSVALTYAVAVGRPLYVLSTDNDGPDVIAQRIAEISGLVEHVAAPSART